MTDYTELIQALRRCQFGHGMCAECPYYGHKGKWNGEDLSDCDDKMHLDAAAAIEALQAQLPKRGEWIVTRYYAWECSVCGKNPTTGMGYVQTRKALYNYCPNCGAKMEVRE